jgi:hypothetical protein
VPIKPPAAPVVRGIATRQEYQDLRDRVAKTVHPWDRDEHILDFVRQRQSSGTYPKLIHGMTASEDLRRLEIEGTTFFFPEVGASTPLSGRPELQKAITEASEHRGQIRDQLEKVRSEQDVLRSKGAHASARDFGRINALESKIDDLERQSRDAVDTLRTLEAKAVDPAAKNPMIRTLADRLTRPEMPERLRKVTREVVFSTQRNSGDTYWAKQYNRPDLKATATGGHDDVVVYNGEGIGIGLYSHEAGHNLANQIYRSTLPAGSSDFQAAIDSGEKPPSSYAECSPAEDFAESVRMFYEEPVILKQIAPRRFAVIERLMAEPNYGG